MAKRQRIVINYGDSIGLTARIEDRTTQAITSGEVSTVCLTLTNLDSDLAVYEACGSNDSELLPAAVIFDTLQTDNSWNVDESGYNFEHTIDADLFATANNWYLARYVVTFINGDARTIEWDIFVRDQVTD
jgi:hypothetical protein